MSTDVLIYCNGDSFVNGYELADDLIEDHPGYYDFDQRHNAELTKPYSDWYSKTMDGNHYLGKIRNSLSEQIIKDQESKAFPNIMHKKTGLDVINAAVSYLGNSQPSIARNTIADLFQLKQKYKKIIAIIGLTSIDRIIVPHNENNWQNKMLTNTNSKTNNHYEEKVNQLLEFYTHYYKDYHLYYEWYKNLYLIKSFCDQHNIVLLWTSGLEEIIEKGNYKNSDIIALSQVLDLQYDVHLSKIAKEINEKVICPGYHYSGVVHEKAADQFISLIYDKL